MDNMKFKQLSRIEKIRLLDLTNSSLNNFNNLSEIEAFMMSKINSVSEEVSPIFTKGVIDKSFINKANIACDEIIAIFFNIRHRLDYPSLQFNFEIVCNDYSSLCIPIEKVINVTSSTLNELVKIYYSDLLNFFDEELIKELPENIIVNTIMTNNQDQIETFSDFKYGRVDMNSFKFTNLKEFIKLSEKEGFYITPEIKNYSHKFKNYL